MNIFIRELKANRKALLIWSVCMFLIVASGMAKYTAYSSDGQEGDVFKDIPYSIKALLGFASFDVTTITGFFAMLFLYIELAAAIHATLLGTGIIAKEERDKTAEFLMVKPISRSTVITAKLLAALFNIIVINAVSLASSLTMVAAYSKGQDVSGTISLFMASMFFIQLIFLAIGMALAACLKKPKKAGSAAAGILLAAFVISKITDMTDKLNILNLLSPFKYFDYAKLVNGNGLGAAAVILSFALAAAFFVLSYLFYQKRDMNI